MKYTHIVRISGDTNDADYIDTEFNINKDFPHTVLEANEVFKGSRAVNILEFLYAIGKGCRIPRAERHNWSRGEYDGPAARHETCINVIKVLFGVDIESDDFYEKHGEDAYSHAINIMENLISDTVPYGEYGIHTIEKN
ncbi:hypothetical protein ACX818_001332 [Acinetobacter baumannii]